MDDDDDDGWWMLDDDDDDEEEEEEDEGEEDEGEEDEEDEGEEDEEDEGEEDEGEEDEGEEEEKWNCFSCLRFEDAGTGHADGSTAKRRQSRSHGRDQVASKAFKQENLLSNRPLRGVFSPSWNRIKRFHVLLSDAFVNPPLPVWCKPCCKQVLDMLAKINTLTNWQTNILRYRMKKSSNSFTSPGSSVK